MYSLSDFQLFLLVGGLILTLIGGAIVFNNRFLSLLDRTIWRDTGVDKIIFTPKSWYWFNRYGRGLGALTLGLGMLLLLIISLWK
jgi:hypothetical protein